MKGGTVFLLTMLQAFGRLKDKGFDLASFDRLLARYRARRMSGWWLEVSRRVF